MSSCRSKYGDKTKHFSRQDAEEHVRNHQRTTNIKVETYRCPTCKYWHVGRQRTTKQVKKMIHAEDNKDEKLTGRLIAALKMCLNRVSNV